MKGIKRHVFAMGDQLPSTIVADAGGAQTVSQISDILLNGSGSTTTDPGGITSYFWEILLGPDYELTTPTNVTCGVTGYAVTGTILFKLTVTDGTGNVGVDTVKKKIDFGVTSLNIDSSIPYTDGTGTLDLTFGDPNETINLTFTLRDANTGDQATVDDSIGSSIFVGDLNWKYPSRNGQVTLNSSGRGSYSYFMDGNNFSMNVEVVQRSSGKAIPSPSSTTINFYDLPPA